MPADRSEGRDDTFRHLWLPYAQMKTVSPPLKVVRTYGSRVVLEDGRELVDGISSWWTACHGYNHPYIRDAVVQQLARMPHVMFAGLAHEPAIRLATRLAHLLPGDLDHVFFSESGSVAVEVALKMAMQYWLNRGERRPRALAFKGGYHGDTFAAMGVSDADEGFHRRFKGFLPANVIAELPRDDAGEEKLERILEREASTLAAMIVEPLVQGAGGMVFHEPTVLRRLRTAADRHGVLLICDEIFTGFGRTGTMFAVEAAEIIPDIITLSKALTGGTMPLAATVATHRVFDAFLSDDPQNALMHGPTFMANPLACAAANASLDLFEHEPRLEQVAAIEAVLMHELLRCRNFAHVKDVRVKGAVGVIELKLIGNVDALRRRFIEAGVWIRPFGNIIYLTPPFTISSTELSTLTGAVRQVLEEGVG